MAPSSDTATTATTRAGGPLPSAREGLRPGAIVFVLGLVLSLMQPAAAGTPPVFSYGRHTSVIGAVKTYTVKPGESLIEIARRFGLGYNEIMAANTGMDPFVPRTGARAIVPAMWVLPDVKNPRGIIINISEMRLYYFFRPKGARKVMTFPIGIGREGRDTPEGKFTVIDKAINPSWYVPASVRREEPHWPQVVPPGPDNPMGSHALRLSLGTILVHGTNKPWGVGRQVSHGCIRLYPEDITDLFGLVPRGTRVIIVRQPVKAGVRKGRVFVEIHNDGRQKNAGFDTAVRLLGKKGLLSRVSMEKLRAAVMKKNGVPTDITRRK